MPYDDKAHGRGGLMVAVTKAMGEGKRPEPDTDGIALVIRGKRDAKAKAETDESDEMLRELAEASIKAHAEEDAASLARIWRHAHDVLCAMQSTHMAPEETED